MVERYYSSTAVETELSSGVDDSTGSISEDSTTGYPTSYPFTIVLDPDTASEELCDVTNTVGTTHTVTRGVDGTVGLSHESGAVVKHTMSGRDLQDSRDHEEADSDVHGIGASSDVMGTETTQTPINKTLDGDDNTFQNIPQSAVTDLVSDQSTQDSDISANAGNISSLTSTVSNHESSSAVHGVGEVVGRTEAQTLTNKTISGQNNSLSRVGQASVDRYILKKNATTSGTLSAGNRVTIMAGGEALHEIAPTGSWAGGSFFAQWTHPVTGLYQVFCALEFGRTNSDQNGPIDLEFRRGMDSGDADSGSVSTEVEQGFVSGSMGSVNTLHLVHLYEVTDTNSIYGLMLFNGGSHTIQRQANGTHFHVIYQGPSS